MLFIIISIKAQLRVRDTFGNLFKHLISEFTERISYVWHLFLDDLLEKRRKLWKGGIIHVVEPTFDEYTIIGLQLEVFSNIVNNYSFWQISSDPAQVFDENWTIMRAVLSVETVLDSLSFINLIEHPISVVLHSSCEYDNLVYLSHFR